MQFCTTHWSVRGSTSLSHKHRPSQKSYSSLYTVYRTDLACCVYVCVVGGRVLVRWMASVCVSAGQRGPLAQAWHAAPCLSKHIRHTGTQTASRASAVTHTVPRTVQRGDTHTRGTSVRVVRKEFFQHTQPTLFCSPKV